jgi:hypothetical protein
MKVKLPSVNRRLNFYLTFKTPVLLDFLNRERSSHREDLRAEPPPSLGSNRALRALRKSYAVKVLCLPQEAVVWILAFKSL